MRGIMGAMLLMIPVVIAATIGFGGGVGVGLTSAFSGPSDPPLATNTGDDSRTDKSASLDELAAAISPVSKQSGSGKKNPLGVPSRGTPASPGGTNPSVPLPPGAGGSDTPPASSPTPQADPGIASGATDSTTSPPVNVPLSGSSNPVADLLNSLLGGGSSGPGS
jgi:hypothetical protein